MAEDAAADEFHKYPSKLTRNMDRQMMRFWGNLISRVVEATNGIRSSDIPCLSRSFVRASRLSRTQFFGVGKGPLAEQGYMMPRLLWTSDVGTGPMI